MKRRQSDIHKYVLYLRELGHQAEKAGDDVIINKQRWKFEDLNNLPIGDRLMDSRTIYNYGAVAFQSAVSPLSNLYQCNIQMNNMSFKSSEQCYQYAKAMHHNMIAKANKIRREPDSHVNMSEGGLITENSEWREKKFRVMESIIRYKFEEVAIIRETLRQKTNHKLIENSWSFMWGTGCPFLGRLLQGAQSHGEYLRAYSGQFLVNTLIGAVTLSCSFTCIFNCKMNQKKI